MKYLFFLFTFFILTASPAQNKQTNEIVKEGKLLFRLEKGSWHGTDDMLARFKTKKDSVGGYLSYVTDDNNINTIFFSRYDNSEILVRYTFNSIPRATPIKIDTINKVSSQLERNLIELREDARALTSSNKEDFFSFYEKTSLNFIPLIEDNKRSVFVLTGPQVSGVVLLGNDYKLSYSNKNILKKKKKIHNTLLQFPYTSDDENNPISETLHSHINTPYISSTDICTLLLYKDYIEWKKHIVMSKKEVSIFDIEKEVIFTMKSKVWNKIANAKN